ncbi:MAG TPA: DUF2723 domain-containing protein [Anaerolineae bacterium]|nr:DUF2723 domain-containing protein [Anaerolineae bacterium]
MPQRVRIKWPGQRQVWLLLTALVVAFLYLSTVQLHINGATHPYTNDVGEIQNALPRWGTLHMPGYPLYSMLGSALVTLFGLLRVEPAAAASLYSMLWGALSAVMIYAVAVELDASPAWAALGAIAASLATSLWADASLAEVYTMTMALLLAALCFALRFERYGRRRDWLWLAFTFGQGVAHHRTVVLLAPALLVLVWPRRREALRHWLPALGLAALAPLTYLYLPIRAWQGERWLYGAVGTWQGFLLIALWTNEVVANVPQGLAAWLERITLVLRLLNDDLWLPFLAAGLAGLCALPWRRDGWRRPVALTLAWLPTVPIALLVWEGRVTDAQLAAKLPLLVLAGVGLALGAQRLARVDRRVGYLAAVVLTALVGAEAVLHRPPIVAVTHDRTSEQMVALGEQIAGVKGDEPVTLMALWGHDYWTLVYAQAYRAQLPGLTLVDHNADMAAIARSERLMTFSKTFYARPLSWWEERLGPTYLSSPAPGIVEISTAPGAAPATPAGPELDLQNGVRILAASLAPEAGGQRVLTVYWQAERRVDTDYSVAVHVLALDPPQGATDILSQADRQHPVDGWYPTSRWSPGEVVRDSYLLAAPPLGMQPVAVRVAMYRAADGGFENSPWLVVPW